MRLEIRISPEEYRALKSKTQKHGIAGDTPRTMAAWLLGRPDDEHPGDMRGTPNKSLVCTLNAVAAHKVQAGAAEHHESESEYARRRLAGLLFGSNPINRTV